MQYCFLFAFHQIFKQFDLKTFRKKSRLLTGYRELLLKNLSPDQEEKESDWEQNENYGCVDVFSSRKRV